MTLDSQDIWNEVQGGLRGFIQKRVTDEAAVEDLSQEIFLRMQRGLGGLKDQSRLLPWIYQIARHVIVDHYRARDRKPDLPVGLAGDLETLSPGSLSVRSSEDSDQLSRELAGCLRPMIERLSEDYRQAVTLVEVEGLTQQAAATRLGLSLSGMKSRVQRGRKLLKQMLEDCCSIHLDCRLRVIDYEVRDAGCDPCGGSPK